MLRSTVGKVMWVGRATVFLVGLAVILALLFGVASTAFAHKGNKGFFHLGHRNVSQAVSKLVGKVAGPSLFIGNGSEDPRATALRLKVKPGKPPMKVNSDAKVPKLNTDKLDGKDSASFLSPERIYTVERDHTPGPNTILGGGASCDQEDQAISGGFRNVASTTQVLTSAADTASGYENIWRVHVHTGSTADSFTSLAVCMDLPPLRP